MNRKRIAALAAGVLALSTVGSLAVASVPATPGGVINGCYRTSTGQLRVIDPTNPDHDPCKIAEGAVSWPSVAGGGGEIYLHTVPTITVEVGTPYDTPREVFCPNGDTVLAGASVTRNWNHSPDLPPGDQVYPVVSKGGFSGEFIGLTGYRFYVGHTQWPDWWDNQLDPAIHTLTYDITLKCQEVA